MMLPWMSETLSSLPAIINMPMFTNEWADCCMMTCLTLARVYIKELELSAHIALKRRRGVYPLWETLRSCGNSNDSRSTVRKAKFALLAETAKFASECNVRPRDVRLQNYAAYTDIYKKLKSNIIFYDEEHAKIESILIQTNITALCQPSIFSSILTLFNLAIPIPH